MESWLRWKKKASLKNPHLDDKFSENWQCRTKCQCLDKSHSHTILKNPPLKKNSSWTTKTTGKKSQKNKVKRTALQFRKRVIKHFTSSHHYNIPDKSEQWTPTMQYKLQSILKLFNSFFPITESWSWNSGWCDQLFL